MSTEYKTLSFKAFIALQEVVKIEKNIQKDLGNGVKMTWYIGPAGSNKFWAVINETVYCFDSYAEGEAFWKATNKPPNGTIKYKYLSIKGYLQMSLGLNYNLITYDFFLSTKMKHGCVNLLSENILKDGRVSLLYCDVSFDGSEPRGYYLVIGRIVISYHMPEPLKRLELSINSGLLQFWRPEISGTMDYIPKYNVSEYDNGRHSKYTLPELFVSEHQLSQNTTAKMYKRVNKTIRYYLRIENKIYSFGSFEDCELILSKLIGRDFSKVPIVDESLYPASIELVANRITRYMNADMYFHRRSEVLTVSETGSLTGLNTLA